MRFYSKPVLVLVALTVLALPLLALLLLTLLASPAEAHGTSDASGLVAGILHPVQGLDHVVAMLAVGLWGGILGRPSLWLLPLAFPLVMAVAGAFGAAGLPMPGVETGIALSGILLGAMVLFAVRMPAWAALVLAGVFAVFHGHAHGAELPSSADPAAFALGFVVATGVLHLCGIAIGGLATGARGLWVVRASGALILMAGGGFLLRALS